MQKNKQKEFLGVNDRRELLTSDVWREYNTELAHILSHDLGAPLRAVLEFSRMLQSPLPQGLSQDQALFLSLVVENSQILQTMIQQIVTWLRVDAEPLHATKMNPNNVLERCLLLFEDRIKQTNAQIKIEPLPFIWSEEESLMQLFTILLENALTYQAKNTHPQIHILALADNESNQCSIKIKDNGVGIATSYHQRIFEPFRRLHTQQEYPGNGMGLAIAARICQRLEGTILIESTPGNGTTFSITLPLREA